MNFLKTVETCGSILSQASFASLSALPQLLFYYLMKHTTFSSFMILLILLLKVITTYICK